MGALAAQLAAGLFLDTLRELEGEIGGGVREEDGSCDLDGVFTLRAEPGALVKIDGWRCVTEVR